MFFNIIFNDIVPIFVVMALGYAGAKMNAFTPSQTQALNKVVLNFALPAALFVSITKATREMLFEDLTLTLVSLIGIVALFLLLGLQKGLPSHSCRSRSLRSDRGLPDYRLLRLRCP